MPKARSDQDKVIGGRIRSRREFLGLSQTELGDYLDVSFQQVQKYEGGVNRVSGASLIKIAEKLQTSVASLMGETESKARTDGVENLLAKPDAIRMLKAFANIKDDKIRSKTIALVEQMADAR